MTNNLRKAKKDLCSFAKKCKDFKYTDSALIIFLITGAISIANNLFSAETGKSIENQKQVITTSIKDIHNQFTEVRKENDRLLKKSNMELIKLMEQGDHVVKSPWSSWQYGVNNFYNDWHGTYKGRGDKKQKYPYEGIFERSKDPFERYTSTISPSYGLLSKSINPYSATTSARKTGKFSYGLTSTLRKQEPLTEMNVDASIRPKEVYRDPITAPTVNISAPVLQALNVPDLLPPSLDIKTPDAIETPNKLPSIIVEPVVSFRFDRHSFVRGGSPDNNVIDGNNLTYWSGWNPDN